MTLEKIPPSMLAWQRHAGSTGLKLTEVPVPSAPSDGLLVQIYAAGLCHSDLVLLDMPTLPPSFPDQFTLGHEGCGRIVQVGSAVSDFKVGELVCIYYGVGCGLESCSECSRSYTQICPASMQYGFGRDGMFAQYVAIEARAAVRIPEGVSILAATAATDAVITAYQAIVKFGALQSTDTVVIFGLGGVGFNGVQIALSIGARVVVVDKRQEVLDEAVKFGVAETDAIPVGANVSEYLKERGVLVDKVFDFVGLPTTFNLGCEVLRPAGTLVLVGLLSPQLTLNSVMAVMKQLTIRASSSGTYQDLEDCLKLIKEAKVMPQVTTGNFKDLTKLYEDLHAGKIKSRIAVIPEGVKFDHVKS